MILPSVSMERKVGAHGCWKHSTQQTRSSALVSHCRWYLGEFPHLVKLQEEVWVVLDDEHVVLPGQLVGRRGGGLALKMLSNQIAPLRPLSAQLNLFFRPRHILYI